MDKKRLKLIVAVSFVIFAVFFSLFYEKFSEDFFHGSAFVPVTAVNENVNEEVEENQEPLGQTENGIIFSHTGHFYEESVLLSFEAVNSDITAIFYTLDGSPPYEEGILYTDEIQLPGGRAVRPFTIKVCGMKEDGSFTTVQTHSYFVGDNVFDRFDTLIFSLSTDPFNLYDEEYGIAVPGRLREQYISETGDKEPDPPAPANFNMRGREAERPVYIELIDRDGQLILAQNGGMRIHGGWSRASNQKSFRLYARRIYDEDNNNFNYNFFPDDFTHYGRPITSYDRLILRNNANDNPFAFLRDESVADMAAAVLPDTQSSRAAAVFLNGEYYGLAWIKQYYDDDYLNDKNEIKNGEWVILKGGATYKNFNEDNPLEVQAAEEYQAIYDLHYNILNDDVFAELCAAIDIDNFLAYYAVQVYTNNFDWPWGNYKVYRYYGEDETKIHDGISTADGKWRWLLFDADWTFGLYGGPVSDESLGRILGIVRTDRGHSPLLLALVNREDMRGRFVAVLCDLMNHHFSPEMVEKTVRKREAERANELYHNFKDGGAQLRNSWSNLDFAANQVNEIIEFGKKRPGEMRKQIEKFLEVEPSGYTITCKPHELADIKLGTIDITNNFSGFYYDLSTVTVTASKADGYIFSHWLVNGEIRTAAALTVGKDDALNGRIDIELVLDIDESGIPVIKLIDHQGSHDFIAVHNPYPYDIDLRKFYLFTDSDNPNRQILADTILKPGQSVILYGRNYLSLDALGGLPMNFNLRGGETINMANINDEIVFSLKLPRIDNEYILVRNIKNGSYLGVKREVLNSEQYLGANSLTP